MCDVGNVIETKVPEMSKLTRRQKLYLDICRCFDSGVYGFIRCEVYCLESRSGIAYFDSAASAERAFFFTVMDCDAVYLEDNTLVLRQVHPRNTMLTEWALKTLSGENNVKDVCALPVQTFDQMVYDCHDTTPDTFSRIHPSTPWIGENRVS